MRGNNSVGGPSAAVNHQLRILSPDVHQGGCVWGKLTGYVAVHRHLGPNGGERVKLPELFEERLGSIPFGVALHGRIFLQTGIVSSESVDGSLVVNYSVTAAFAGSEICSCLCARSESLKIQRTLKVDIISYEDLKIK